MKKIFIIQNVAHENLGMLEEHFKKEGCALDYHDPSRLMDAQFDHDALIMMGGPMSVYDTTEFPHLIKAAQLIRQAYVAGKPILGICLGAQMIAKAFDAKVKKNPVKEIGWYPLEMTSAAKEDALFSSFKNLETVFQWHGDTFELPSGAVLLASSPLCKHQAFRLHDHIYGLQFHVEVSQAMVNEWLDETGNKQELESLKDSIHPAQIKQDTSLYMPRLNELSLKIAQSFLKRV